MIDSTNGLLNLTEAVQRGEYPVRPQAILKTRGRKDGEALAHVGFALGKVVYTEQGQITGTRVFENFAL